jgi:hypothetical protein
VGFKEIRSGMLQAEREDGHGKINGETSVKVTVPRHRPTKQLRFNQTIHFENKQTWNSRSNKIFLQKWRRKKLSKRKYEGIHYLQTCLASNVKRSSWVEEKKTETDLHFFFKKNNTVRKGMEVKYLFKYN